MFEWMIPLLVFLSSFLLIREIQRVMRETRLRKKALEIAGSRKGGAGQARNWKEEQVRFFFRSVALLTPFQTRWVPQPWGARMEKRINRVSPWQSRTAGEWLAGKEISLAAGVLVAWLLGLSWLLTLAVGAIMFFLPELWLREKEKAKQRGIMRELPDTLDLLASCMEAGLGFEQSLGVMIERGRKGFLLDEFSELMRSIRMGQSRRDALGAMANRVGETDFTTFITALIQAERLGVSVAAALKQQGSQLRTKRSQLIEKLALEAPVKLLFPLVIFIFPVVFLILFGPIIIRFMQGF